MSIELRETIRAAIECHQKLKQLAEAEDWDAFVEQAPVCQEAIRQIDTQGSESADNEIREQLQHLLNLNNEIREITESQRDKLAEALRDLNQGRKAHKAYNQ